MNRLTTIFTGAAMFLFCWRAHAEPLSSPDQLRSYTESVMQRLAIDDIDGAIALVRQQSSVQGAKFEASAEQLKQGLSTQIKPVFGNAIGQEFVREEKLGASLVKYTFFQKRDKGPVRWQFIFYRGIANWSLCCWNMDGEIMKYFPN
jgi:hypothetical protein